MNKSFFEDSIDFCSTAEKQSWRREVTAGHRLKKFVFLRGWLEAEERFCDCIQLLNKNSLWIRFVKAVSFVISNSCNFEFEAVKNKRIHVFAI
jgi:hypothetical protein